MESLPKAKKKNIPKSVHDMNKEMLQETLKKKKLCNAKALAIVEKLCEIHVDENWLLENLQFINQCHFEDIITERAILKICGYPLCDQELKNVPAQQYHISVKHNKVFDITERKNFCSAFCYKSAMYVKKQLFTSPLWFRDQEVIPKYKILRSSRSSMDGEIVFFPDEIKPDLEDGFHIKVLNKVETKGLEELEEKYSCLNIDSSQKNLPNVTLKKVDGNVSSEKKNETVLLDLSKEDSALIEKMRKASESSMTCDNNTDKPIDSESKVKDGEDDVHKDNISLNPKKSEVRNPKKIKTKIKNEDKPASTVEKVEKSIFEWFSLHTLLYLYGEEKLKELLCDKADEIKQVLNSKLSQAGVTDKIDRMIQLYGLLDADLCSKKENKMSLKPLPDYSVLKKEKDTIEIKVKAFYQGQLEVKQSVTEEKEKEEEETHTDNETIYLPFVDAHSQIPLRRKILLDKLNKIIPDLIKIFSLDYTLHMNEVRNLVTTFTLGAHNITFKPYEWYLVGIIIIKLLSLKDMQLESVMKLESSEDQILLILANYKLPKEYLHNLLNRLTDSKNLVKKINEINS